MSTTDEEIEKLLAHIDDVLATVKKSHEEHYKRVHDRPPLVPFEVVGDFTLASTNLRVTDPCYGQDDRCAGVINDALPGVWTAAVIREDTGMWGYRVKELLVWHKMDGSEEQARKASEDSKIDVGVDSGQAGFFDDEKFVGGDDDHFYDEACKCTSGPTSAGVLESGVVSSSGIGDGGYRCYLSRTGDGKVMAARIDYLPAEEDAGTPDA